VLASTRNPCRFCRIRPRPPHPGGTHGRQGSDLRQGRL